MNGKPQRLIALLCRIFVAVPLLLVLDGCASLKNTPQQDYVFSLGERCRTSRFWVEWVSADGKRWRGNIGDTGHEIQFFNQCMREQFRATPYEQWWEQHRAEYDQAKR